MHNLAFLGVEKGKAGGGYTRATAPTSPIGIIGCTIGSLAVGEVYTSSRPGANCSGEAAAATLPRRSAACCVACCRPGIRAAAPPLATAARSGACGSAAAGSARWLAAPARAPTQRGLAATAMRYAVAGEWWLRA